MYRLGKHEFRSRLIIGSGKYASFEENRRALDASGAELITVSVRRIDVTTRESGSLLDHIPPEQFIPYAEDSGLIVPLGKFVLWEAVRAIRSLQRRFDPEMFMSVNLSPRQLAESDLMSEVASAIGETGVHSRSLVLELTESMMMQQRGE